MDHATAACEDGSNPILLNMVDSFEANLVMADNEIEEVEDQGEEDEGESKLDLFAEFIVEAKDTLTTVAIVSKMDDLEIKNHKGLAVYVQVVFSEGNILESLNKQLSILKDLCKDSKSQKSLLGGLERVLGLTNKSQLPKIPLVLKKLYEMDILDEGTLVHWADRPSKKFVGSREVARSVRQAAAPFIEWLKNAEEDSDRDSEHEDEDEE